MFRPSQPCPRRKGSRSTEPAPTTAASSTRPKPSSADTYAHVGNAQAREAGERLGAVISFAAIRAVREAAGAVAVDDEPDVSKM